MAALSAFEAGGDLALASLDGIDGHGAVRALEGARGSGALIVQPQMRPSSVFNISAAQQR